MAIFVQKELIVEALYSMAYHLKMMAFTRMKRYNLDGLALATYSILS